MFGMQKKEMIASFIELDSNSPFWVDYDAYELERKALGQKRLAILSDYAENYLSLSDEKTDDLIKQMQVQKKSKENFRLESSSSVLPVRELYFNRPKI